MLTNRRPLEICDACFEEQRGSYVSQVLLYCKHSKTFAARDTMSGPWITQGGVSLADAEMLRAVAFSDLASMSAEQGISLQDAEAALQRHFGTV